MHHKSRDTGVSGERLRVAVLVDLIWSPLAGGHVKCWERLAHAATRRSDLDLTVHFSGTSERVVDLSENVRFRIHRSVFSTARLPFLGHIPDHTDLSPYHPDVARCISDVDVIHTTDGFFAFARTGARLARRKSIPLVNSVHTDTPSYTRVYTRQMINRLFGDGVGSRILLDRLQLDRRLERNMRNKLERHQIQSTHSLVATEDECLRLRAARPNRSVHVLGRGIDRSQFHPCQRDREWLRDTFGVPVDRVIVLFVGRLDSGKRILTLAETVRGMVDSGLPIHLFCAGRGPDRQLVIDRLGDHVTAPGFVTADLMPKVFASADILAMPSEIEVFANVVPEAMASGIVPVVSSGSRMGRLLEDGRTGIVIDGAETENWTSAISDLVRHPERMTAMGREARLAAETSLPSWDDILANDLVHLWRQAATGQSGSEDD
ncbi:MAG: glycosyltransferase [Alphaproteobacteria bacterium]|nr:glycosyltransferase [Alphaproteobacteria bacterium]